MSSPGRRKVNKEEARQHELTAWNLRQRGWTLERIAARMTRDAVGAGGEGVTTSGVSKILKRCRENFARNLTEDVEQWREEQRAQLSHAADEYMQAWERSKEDVTTAVKQTTKTVGDEEGEGHDTEETLTLRKEGQCGDRGYLNDYRATLAQLAKLDGLDAAQKFEVTGRLTCEGVILDRQDERKDEKEPKADEANG